MSNKSDWYPDTMTMGVGRYSSSTHPRIYTAWSGMIRRCYSPKAQEYRPTYKGCLVALEFHNFQNFAKWVLEQEPRFEMRTWLDLDKDLKVPGNKIYSPDTCLLVNYRLNVLFTGHKSDQRHLQLGVTENGNGYKAQCFNGSNKMNHKHFCALSGAVEWYWVEKFKVVQMYMKKYPDLADILYNYFFWFQNKHTFGFDHPKQWAEQEVERLAA